MISKGNAFDNYYFTNPKKFIETSLKLLRKGGKLILSVPNHDSFMGLDDENFLDMPPHHMGLWNEKSLVAIQKFFPIVVSKIYLGRFIGNNINK